MPYTLHTDDIASITDTEVAFSTTRLLPAETDIPEAFWTGNTYTQIIERLFYGHTLPHVEIAIREDVTPEMLNRLIRSHLASFTPKHEYKIAGVGYMMAQVATIEDGIYEPSPHADGSP